MLYQADWSAGLSGWPSTFGWKVLNGTLINDGSNRSSFLNWIAAPNDLSQIPDYAVEAEIQLVSGSGGVHFGLVARASYNFAVDANYGYVRLTTGQQVDYYSTQKIAERRFDIDGQFHTHRVEVKGNVIRYQIDGATVLEATDNRYLAGGTCGLFSSGAQVIVRRFKIGKRSAPLLPASDRSRRISLNLCESPAKAQ